MPAPGSGVSGSRTWLQTSISWLQTSISPGRWARSIRHLLGARLALFFHGELNMAHRVQRDVPRYLHSGRGLPPAQLPMHCLACSPTAHSRRQELLSFSLCSIAEVSIFPRTPSSGKAPSPLQASHLQSFAGKCSPSGKAEIRPTVSHSGRGARSEGFEAVVGGDGLRPCCPVQIPHALTRRGHLGKTGSC